jgi:hypothetical protein
MILKRHPVCRVAGSVRFLILHLCHEYKCTDYTVGIIPVPGIGFHSFADGGTYAVQVLDCDDLRER